MAQKKPKASKQPRRKRSTQGDGPASKGVTVTDSIQGRPAPEEAAVDAFSDALALPTSSLPFPIVGIGASAGGLDAFTQVLEGLPPEADLALIFVQHLLADRKSELARFSPRSPPGPSSKRRTAGRSSRGMSMSFRRTPRSKSPTAISNSRRARPTMVIITCRSTICSGRSPRRRRKRQSGSCFPAPGRTARRASARFAPWGASPSPSFPTRREYDGMPRAAIATDGVDLVLPPAKIGPELARIAGRAEPHRHVRPGREGDTLSVDDDDLRRVFMLLRGASGVDFGQYKLPTVRRRIQRRMTLQKSTSSPNTSASCARIRRRSGDLYRDILIHVTRFFREPESFQTLADEVFPGDPGSPPRRRADADLGAGLLDGRRTLFGGDER